MSERSKVMSELNEWIPGHFIDKLVTAGVILAFCGYVGYCLWAFFCSVTQPEDREAEVNVTSERESVVEDKDPPVGASLVEGAGSEDTVNSVRKSKPEDSELNSEKLEDHVSADAKSECVLVF